MDRIRRVGHAVLAVYALGDILILDSLTDLIFSHRKYRHYVPQYSMNETTRWAHFYGENSRIARSEEHTSELQSLMRISYAVFCLKKKSITRNNYMIQEFIQNMHHSNW